VFRKHLFKNWPSIRNCIASNSDIRHQVVQHPVSDEETVLYALTYTLHYIYSVQIRPPDCQLSSLVARPKDRPTDKTSTPHQGERAEEAGVHRDVAFLGSRGIRDGAARRRRQAPPQEQVQVQRVGKLLPREQRISRTRAAGAAQERKGSKSWPIKASFGFTISDYEARSSSSSRINNE